MTKIIFTIAMALLILPSLAFAQNDEYGRMGGRWHMMHYGGFMMWILLIIGVILFVFLIAHLLKTKDNKPKSKGNAMDTLKNRYARGEITKEEYEQLKHDIAD